MPWSTLEPSGQLKKAYLILTCIGNKDINFAEYPNDLLNRLRNLSRLGNCRSRISISPLGSNQAIRSHTINLISSTLDIVHFCQLLRLFNSSFVSVKKGCQILICAFHSIITYELYHRTTLAPASAIASVTARPIPSAAPVTTTTFPAMRNWSSTLEGMLGNGRGNPSRT